MTAKNAKTAIIYARYSTDRQTDVCIETQVQLCQSFIADRGWQLIDTYSDKAVSGSDYMTRPCIQRVLERITNGKVDLVLCVTVDRVSRDAEHGNGFLKRLRYHNTELWTVYGGSSVTDIEMSLRVTLSQELVAQIRYRTREGMKTAVRRGKATTCLAYGYRIKLEYDAHGERISGPRAAAWRDTAIRGHIDRGTGILNNELYLGGAIWSRREYRKNPDTEHRIARHNDSDDWAVTEVPSVRITPDDLWSAVKRQQSAVRDEFARTDSNRLNRTHRPSYLLSGMLECAECGGSYAIMVKERYGCSNHKNKLPIDGLDGACRSNQKTILRKTLEDRVLSCLPAAFFGMGIFDDVAGQARQNLAASMNKEPDERQFIQKVVIGKTPGYQPASLEVHGRIASILAAMEAATILEKQFEALKQHDYLEKLRAGELETEHKKKKLLDAYAEELSVKRLEWQ
ncbi:recombinase family protein, partial [Rhizobium lemnae]